MERRDFLKGIICLPLAGLGAHELTREDPPKRGIRKVAKWTGAQRRKLEVTDSRFYEPFENWKARMLEERAQQRADS